MKHLTPLPLLASLLILAGCWQIWNAGDLIEWVEAQAVREGCDEETIELADWYVGTDDGNSWPGTCVDSASGETKTFAIGIDSVWTPSEQAPEMNDSPDEASSSAMLGDTPLNEEKVQNSSYSGIYDEPVPLVDGRHEGEPYVEGETSRPTVEYIPGSARYGDLDGDGADDAVVFLIERGGGTGAFVYVAAQLNHSGEPVDAGALRIEDRIQVISVDIEDGLVTLAVTAEGPGDAACCRTHKMTQQYALQDGMLVELPAEEGEELERISFSDLNGTLWTLSEINYDEPALDGTEVTAFFEDGEIRGTGGCNTYNGLFVLGEDNPFVVEIGPIMSTQMMCEQPVADQETAYLTALENATQWGYEVGNLVIYYFIPSDQAPRRLLFAAAAGINP